VVAEDGAVLVQLATLLGEDAIEETRDSSLEDFPPRS